MSTKLEHLAQTYHHVQEVIRQKRNEWQDGKKEMVSEYLRTIADTIPIRWYAHLLENEDNDGDILCIRFPNEIKNQQVINKGCLHYFQVRTGDIAVYFTYPYSTPEEIEIVQIQILPPSEITEEAMRKHLEVFLEKMIIWETNSNEKKVGFKIS
jgi:hypothetical protein